MQILYKPILNIHLWHDYALGQPEMPYELAPNYGVSDILTLRPTKACEKTLKNLRWVARSHPQGLTLFAEVEAVAPNNSDTDYRTKIPVDRPTRLSFWLEVKDPNFANFTNLPLTAANNQKIYYFSNVSGSTQSYDRETESGGTETVEYLFLSQPLQAYNAAAEYFLNSFVIDGDNAFESLTYQSSAANLRDANAWMPLPRSEYISAQDQLLRQHLSRMQTEASASPGTLTFSLTDINDQRSFEQVVEVPDTHPSGDPLKFSLNFVGQTPGRYQLVVGNTVSEEVFVLLDPLEAPKAFALVELAIASNTVREAFALLKADGDDTLIQPRNYIIRFKNRATRWRYRTLTPHSFDSTAPPDGFVVIDEQTYVTATPRGLLRQFSSPIPNNGLRNLPFPSPAQIKTDDNRPVTQVFSDIYL